MNVDTLKALIAERDDEFRKVQFNDEYSSLGALFDTDEPIRLFNGGKLRREAVTDHFAVDYNGSRSNVDDWDCASGQAIVVEYVQPPGNLAPAEFFKVEGWYDSWDNGHEDIWKTNSITKVEKQVATVWKEVQ